MARYLEIIVLQEPFDMGLDSQSKPRVGFNLIAIKTQSSTFLEEVISMLVTAEVGRFTGNNRNIFASAAANIPSGDGPFLVVAETGGTAPERIHNQLSPAYQRPGAQLVARATSYQAARTMAIAAYNALVGVRNHTVNV